MSENIFTTNVIKTQLQNLIVCHTYKVTYKLHYTNKNFSAYLDKETLDFTANNTFQNIFVVLTKDTRIKNVLLEIKAKDLTDDSILINSSFINCFIS